MPMKRNQINNKGKAKKGRCSSASVKPIQQISTSPFRFLFGRHPGFILFTWLPSIPCGCVYFQGIFRVLKVRDWDHCCPQYPCQSVGDVYALRHVSWSLGKYDQMLVFVLLCFILTLCLFISIKPTSPEGRNSRSKIILSYLLKGYL